MKNLSIVEATREACDFFSNNGEKYLFDCAVNSHFKTYISKVGQAYKSVKNDLNSGRIVLFSYMVNNSSSRKRYASPKAGTELYLDLVFRQ